MPHIRLCHFLPILVRQTRALESLKLKLIFKTVFVLYSHFHRAVNPWFPFTMPVVEKLDGDETPGDGDLAAALTNLQGDTSVLNLASCWAWVLSKDTWVPVATVLFNAAFLSLDTHTFLPSKQILGFPDQDDLWCLFSSYLTWNIHSPTMLKFASGFGSLFKDCLPLLGSPQSSWHTWWLIPSRWTDFSSGMLLRPSVNQWMKTELREVERCLPPLTRTGRALAPALPRPCYCSLTTTALFLFLRCGEFLWL